MIFKNFLFYIGMSVINNVVSVAQQNVSVTHTHVSVLFRVLSTTIR